MRESEKERERGGGRDRKRERERAGGRGGIVLCCEFAAHLLCGATFAVKIPGKVTPGKYRVDPLTSKR